MPTVRVRIAVAVNAKGEWWTSGSWLYSDAICANSVTGQTGPTSTLHFVEVDVPVPDDHVLQGKLVQPVPAPPKPDRCVQCGSTRHASQHESGWSGGHAYEPPPGEESASDDNDD